MKKIEVKGSIEEFMGKRIEKIEYTTEAEQYENLVEAKNSEDWLSDAEILRAINQKKVAAAKASKYQELTKPMREAYDKSDEKKIKDFVDAAVKAGVMNEEQATAAAKAAMGKA